jgi:hypothetical protein
MSFKEVQDLDADVTVALGGKDKKTGKPNPTRVEGYYLGARKVESKFGKDGFSFIYIFQTQKGKIGVWGKTDLDRKMLAVTPGNMTRVTQSGSVSTPRGDMMRFKVEVDADNTIEVNVAGNTADADGDEAPEDTSSAYDSGIEEEESAPDADEEPLDEVQVTRAAPPKQVAATPDAIRQAKVKALLANGRNKDIS